MLATKYKPFHCKDIKKAKLENRILRVSLRKKVYFVKVFIEILFDSDY